MNIYEQAILSNTENLQALQIVVPLMYLMETVGLYELN